jgi:hypothetical protein
MDDKAPGVTIPFHRALFHVYIVAKQSIKEY